MRSRTAAAALMIIIMAIPGYSQVNGTVEEINGKTVLTVWGTHAERGYAHGFLLAEQAKEVFESYLIEHVCYGQASIYNAMYNFYRSNYAVDEQYQAEIEAMVEGIEDAGVSLFNETLGRDLGASDLLAANAIVDLSQAVAGLRPMHLGCSSLSSWGESTFDDSTLVGDLIVTRLMDWENHPTLAENHILAVSMPAEGDEQAWISMTFPSFVGALSAINDSGVSAFLNVGNRTDYQLGDPFYPILLTVRNGIEHGDYDEDGEATSDDIVSAVEDRNRSSGTIIHTTKNQGSLSLPLIIECNNERGVAVRNASDNTVVPANHLVATNHFRELYDPVYCNRYSAIADSLDSDRSVSQDRCWTIMGEGAGVGSNLHAIQYLESQSLLRWATSTVESPAYLNEPAVFDIRELFDPGSGTEGPEPDPRRLNFEQSFPNPFSASTTIHFALRNPQYCRLCVYSMNGRRIATLSDGILGGGAHSVSWDGISDFNSEVGAGAYIIALETESEVCTRRLLRIR